MKKVLVIAAAFLVVTAFKTLNGVWKSDPPHSRLGFTVTHLGIADISGRFNDFSVTVTSEKSDFSDAKFELSGKITSIDTGVEARDNHLKTAEFFDAEKYPTIAFKSTSLKKSGKGKYKMTGDLTLHGVTKAVAMEVLYRGTTENPMNKKQTAGFLITGTLKRTDFGIGSQFPSAMISDLVEFRADAELIQDEK